MTQTTTPAVSAVHPELQLAAREALEGKRRGLRAILPFLGPAFIACVAYIDPGNFATNISGGAEFGYALLWVIAMANLMAMLIQSMSAKLGIATGRNLAELCGERFPTGVSYTLWITQEVMAMATDLAEFLGAAIGINLLFGIPMIYAGLITAVGVFGILAVQGNGFRGIEWFITAMVGIIAGCYLVETLLAKAELGNACDTERLLELVERPVEAGRAIRLGDPEHPGGSARVEVEDNPAAMTSRSPAVSARRAASISGERPSGNRSSKRSGEAVSCSRRCRRVSERRMRSSATVRATWQSQVRAEPRLGSNRCQRRSARSNVSPARSSARNRSPVNQAR